METINDSCVKGKRILLLYARFFGYDVIVKNKLESLGAQVDLYDARANINTVEKAIKKVDSRFYYKKQKKFHRNIIQKTKDNKYDFIFSNENIARETLLEYKKAFPKATLVLYLDDSVENMKGVNENFDIYDRVLTFDRKDAQDYGVIFRPLFFCDTFKKLHDEKVKEINDICFIGTCHSDRLFIVDQIMTRYPKLKYFLYCYLQSWFMYYYYRLRDPAYKTKSKQFFVYKQMPMDVVGAHMAESRAILDIQHPKQTGLTMRTIETLGLGKKIITTNTDIENYDYFDPNNVLLIDRNNPIIDEGFINSPYHPIDAGLYHKYSIEGWIEEVFGE